jgi:hypothetical protein
MSFEGPETRDYENVVSLNLAWLDSLKHDRAARTVLASCAGPQGQQLCGLDPVDAARLAESPFLLFSYREHDHDYWDRIFARPRGRDLFDAPATGQVATLTHAALGFIWQLASRNPYALRLFSGASLHWCECIADLTFIRLLEAVRSAGDIPVLRLAGNQPMWLKLLSEGVSSDSSTRHAAQFAALQTILTDCALHREREPIARAARGTKPPGLRVADLR